MAMKPCRKCKDNVREEADICAHCGVSYPAKRPGLSFFRIVKYSAGGFLLLVVTMCSIGLATNRGKAGGTSPTSEAPSVELQPAHAAEVQPSRPSELVLSDNEARVARTLVETKLIEFARTGKVNTSLVGLSTHIALTADEFQRAYEKNEVGADQRFGANRLHVRGAVDSVNKDVFGKVFITLIGGTNMFMRPHARMVSGYDEWLGQLSKGNQIELTCRADGMVMGSGMLSECTPTNIWAYRLAENVSKGLNDLIKNGVGEASTLAATAIGVALVMPAGAKCWSDVDACEVEVKKALPKAKASPEAKA